MHILVLDDEKIRHEVFSIRYTKHEVDHAWGVTQCINLLQIRDKYDLISLDHDLGGHSQIGYAEPGELTGTDVANWIARNLPREKWPDRLIIHSWNIDGAIRMAKILNSVGISTQREEFHPISNEYELACQKLYGTSSYSAENEE